MTQSSYQSNGQYVLTKLSVFVKSEVDETETEWNLLPSFIECSLFEALNDQTMSGYVAVLDTVNVFDFLPLYGNERIELEFHTAGAEDYAIEYTGYIYKITDRVRVTDQTMGYIIRFCSEASILSERVYTQKGFEDTADNVVKAIYDEFLSGETKKQLTVQPAQEISTYTLGTLHPLDAIAVVINGVTATDGTTGYIFYENNKEYRLDTLQTLYQQEPKNKYTSAHHGKFDDVKNRVAEVFERVQNIVYMDENSFLDRMQDGVHGSDHVYFDLIRKQAVNHHYNRDDEFDKTKSLGDRPTKKKLDDGTDVLYISYVNDTLDTTKDLVISRMTKIESESFKATITVFGDSNLKVGDLLDVYFPRLNNNQEEVATAYEGKVLISAIRHTITKDKYMQEIEVIKDAYNEESV